MSGLQNANRFFGCPLSPGWRRWLEARNTTTRLAEAPPSPNVVLAAEPTLFGVDNPEHFPLATATERPAFSELVVTGTVAPDIARNVPVVSLASAVS